MNKIRNIILATAIALLPDIATAEEQAKKPDEHKDLIYGHSAQQII